MTFATINNDTTHPFNQEELARLTLIACDQSYKGAQLAIGDPLALFPDSPNTPYANAEPFYASQIPSSGFVVVGMVDHQTTG